MNETSTLLDRAKAFEVKYQGRHIWSIFLFGFAALSAFFMFLIHVVAVRMLSTAEYGRLSSALALVGILGVGASSVQAVTVLKVKESHPPDKVKATSGLERFLLVGLCTFIALIAMILIRIDVATAILLGCWVPAAIILASANGEIQGRELQGLLHGSTMLVTSATLVLSVLVSLLQSTSLMFLISRLLVTVIFSIVLLRIVQVPITHGLKFMHRNIIHSTLLISTMWFAANMSVLLGRNTLDDDSVGEIAIAAMLVNSSLLIPGLIASVFYPRVVASKHEQDSLWPMLRRSLFAVTLLQLSIAIALILTGPFLVDWLAGQDHQLAETLVLPLSLASIPFGILIVSSQFVLALGRLKESILFMSITSLGTLSLVILPSSAMNFAKLLNVVAWALAMSMVLITVVKIHGKDNAAL
jgi:O-antigen/teichoic acid export membrane protein